MNNYDYPIGADTKDAPWNQTDPEPREYECKVNYSMECESTYMTEVYDDDGDSLLDWKGRTDAWRESHKTSIELLGCLHDYLQGDLERVCDQLKDNPKDRKLASEKKRLERLIVDCLSWTECDCEAY